MLAIEANVPWGPLGSYGLEGLGRARGRKGADSAEERMRIDVVWRSHVSITAVQGAFLRNRTNRVPQGACGK